MGNKFVARPKGMEKRRQIRCNNVEIRKKFAGRN